MKEHAHLNYDYSLILRKHPSYRVQRILCAGKALNSEFPYKCEKVTLRAVILVILLHKNKAIKNITLSFYRFLKSCVDLNTINIHITTVA